MGKSLVSQQEGVRTIVGLGIYMGDLGECQRKRKFSPD